MSLHGGEFCSRTTYRSVALERPFDIFDGLASLILHRLKATITITSVRPGAVTSVGIRTVIFRFATLCNLVDMCRRIG
jgi:hypothetical protein